MHEQHLSCMPTFLLWTASFDWVYSANKYKTIAPQTFLLKKRGSIAYFHGKKDCNFVQTGTVGSGLFNNFLPYEQLSCLRLTNIICTNSIHQVGIWLLLV